MSYLEQALAAVTGDRRRDYGSALINHLRIAVYWNQHLIGRLKRPITPPLVAELMILLKMAREKQTHKDDNFVDIIGYSSCIDSMHEEMVQLGFENGNLAFRDFTFNSLHELLMRMEARAEETVTPEINVTDVTEKRIVEKLNEILKRVVTDDSFELFELPDTGEAFTTDLGESSKSVPQYTFPEKPTSANR